MSHLHVCCLELVGEGGQRPAASSTAGPRTPRSPPRSLPVPPPYSSAAPTPARATCRTIVAKRRLRGSLGSGGA